MQWNLEQNKKVLISKIISFSLSSMYEQKYGIIYQRILFLIQYSTAEYNEKYIHLLLYIYFYCKVSNVTVAGKQWSEVVVTEFTTQMTKDYPIFDL